MTEELIGVTEAAKLLEVDRTTIWRWIEEGKLKPFGYSRGPERKRALLTRRSVQELVEKRGIIAVA
jgi:predicted site-specific integrase-resolvase